MIAIIMTGVAALLYLLGATITSEYLETLEEAEGTYMTKWPRRMMVWGWPIHVAIAQFMSDDDE